MHKKKIPFKERKSAWLAFFISNKIDIYKKNIKEVKRVWDKKGTELMETLYSVIVWDFLYNFSDYKTTGWKNK